MGKYKKKGVTRLSKLDADEISFVPQGANLRKLLRIKKSFKGEQDMTLEEILKQLGGGNADEGEIKDLVEKALPDGSKSEKAAMKAAMTMLKKMGDKMKDKPAELKKLMDQMEKMVGVTKEDPSADPQEVDKDPVSKEGNMDKVSIQKMIDEAVSGATKELKETVEKQAETIKSFENERDLASYEREIEGLHIPGDKKEIAKSLKSLKDTAGEEAYKKHVEILKSASEARVRGDLLGEIGSNQSMHVGDKEKDLVAKEMESNPKLTREQASERVYEKHPELYEESLG